MTVRYRMKMPLYFITLDGTELKIVCEELDPNESLIALFEEIVESFSDIKGVRIEKSSIDYVKERINAQLEDKIWSGELYFHNLTNKWMYESLKDKNGDQDISG